MSRKGPVTVIISAAALSLAPFAAATTVDVSFSPELTEKFDDTYGQREAEYLTKKLTEDLTRAFGDDAGMVERIAVVVEDAKPNRPTIKEMGDRIGLSLQSFSLGGAELSGKAFDASGREVASLNYDWYETQIEWAQYQTTWGDAHRAFSRFASRLAENAGNAGS